MADKKIVAVVGILMVGAATVLLLDRKTESLADPRLGRPLADAADAISADRIEIKKGESTVVMARDAESTWRLGDEKGFPVDATKVLRMMDELSRTKLTMVMATEKDAMEQFGLAAPTSVKASLQGKDILQVNIGTARNGGGQYVSIGGEYKAYLTDQQVSAYSDASEWELKTILNIDKAVVKSVAFFPADLSNGSVTLAREKAEEPLKVQGLTEPRKEKGNVTGAESIAASVTFVRRYDKGNEEARAALAQPSKAFVTLFDGRNFEILVGSIGEKPKKYFLKINADASAAGIDAKLAADAAAINALMSANAFEVPQHIGQRFEKGANEFVESPKG